jgi:hypothetical protein
MKRNRVREAFDRLQKELIKAAHTKDSASDSDSDSDSDSP